MNANGYLTRIAASAFTRQLEKENIERSFDTLRDRLDQYFYHEVENHFPFGSYTRGTMLPRGMDPQSDIDYMILFADSDVKPQAYLDRLRRFVEFSYPSSEIAQSTPTIVLSLNHIRFELVPSIKGFWGGLKIPSRSGGTQTWMDTEPNEFNQRLTEKNKNNQNLIKPLVRVLKYWNAKNGYPFESYQLEQMIVDHGPVIIWLFDGNLWERFVSFVGALETSSGDPAYKRDAIDRAKSLVGEIKAHESHGEEYPAQRKLERLLPPVD